MYQKQNETKQRTRIIWQAGSLETKSTKLLFVAGFIGVKAAASANSELLIYEEITYLASLFYANKIKFRELTTDLGRIHYCACSAGPVHDRS
jgi:hypothetical protein